MNRRAFLKLVGISVVAPSLPKVPKQKSARGNRQFEAVILDEFAKTPYYNFDFYVHGIFTK
jgi:hypothetical protein